MAQRLVIRVDQSSTKKNNRYSWLVKLFFLVMLPVILARRYDEDAFDWKAVLLSDDALFPMADETLTTVIFSGVLVGFIIMMAMFGNFGRRKAEKDKDLEFIVAVYPVGVQLSSTKEAAAGGAFFIPRDRIIDFHVQEIILAHRVYSSPRLVLRKVGDCDDGTETVELFPEVDLLHAECQQVCGKLREMLQIGKT